MSLLRDTRKLIRVTAQRAASLFRPPQQPLNVDDVLSSGRGRDVVDDFHRIWYASVTAGQVRWQGHEILKNPLDLWIYQELIFEHRPDVLIETGTHHGASALYCAMIARVAGHPMRVITIDFNPKLAYDPKDFDIVPVIGISTTVPVVREVEEQLTAVRGRLGREPRVMVVLDSDHSRDNVLEELRTYAPLVTPGQYLIVEDTNVNGHPAHPGHGPGPYEAVEAFLAETDAFERDRGCHKFLFTLNPDGWLRRVR